MPYFSSKHYSIFFALKKTDPLPVWAASTHRWSLWAVNAKTILLLFEHDKYITYLILHK